MAGIDIISDSTGKEIVAAIQSTDVAQARISEINAAADSKKNEVLESIPEDYRNTVNDVNELKSDLVNNRLLLLGNIIDGEFVQDGIVYPYNTTARTDYIDVTLHKKIEIYSASTFDNRSAEFNSNKVFIRNIPLKTGNNIITLTDDTAYIMLSDSVENMRECVLKSNEYRSTYDIDNMKKTHIRGINDFKYSIGAYDENSKYINPNANTRIRTEYIPVTKGDIVYWVAGEFDFWVNEFDVAKNFILNSGLQRGSKYTVLNDGYIIINIQNWYNVAVTSENINDFVNSVKIYNVINSIYPIYKNLLPNTVITVGNNGDFKSILEAMKNTPDTQHILIQAGTYDLFKEYSDYYGSDFWENYNGYSLDITSDPYLRGLWVSNGRILEGSSGVTITFNPTISNPNINNYFSLVAMGYNGTLKNIKLDIGNDKRCRYAVHDDFSSPLGDYGVFGTNLYEHCIFKGNGVNRGALIGAGCGSHDTYIIRDCIFENEGEFDISYHANNHGVEECKIIVTGCYGTKKCSFRYYGNHTTITDCIVSNSQFGKIELVQHENTYDTVNMRLIKFNCVETESN